VGWGGGGGGGRGDQVILADTQSKEIPSTKRSDVKGGLVTGFRKKESGCYFQQKSCYLQKAENGNESIFYRSWVVFFILRWWSVFALSNTGLFYCRNALAVEELLFISWRMYLCVYLSIYFAMIFQSLFFALTFVDFFTSSVKKIYLVCSFVMLQKNLGTLTDQTLKYEQRHISYLFST